ncbi:complement C1q-like protein 4 [Perca flavescens]|uniref:complement C1q-like protein 4 n=1 Tax=Perca flavescens TaxID=8167 RepID=UPI00106EEB59|nr:complement C1q-like protein 4 [Perca flavescens]
MKISVSFTLWLLLGAVSAEESTDYQLPFPQDIYAALGQMTTSLDQLKADMRLLQRETQGTVMDSMTKETVSDIAEQVSQLKTEVDKLKQQQQGRQVAFSASLLAGGQAGTLGPFPSHPTLVFKHVVTNIGNAYNPNTGVFTAPVRGAYNFEWSIGAHGNNRNPSAAWLVKNSEHVFIAYEYEPAGFMSSSNGATLLLEVGDIVFVRLAGGTRAYDDINHHTTFSGSLLFTM